MRSANVLIMLMRAAKYIQITINNDAHNFAIIV